MQVHHNRLLLRSIGEFLNIALQLVPFKARVHGIVVVREGAVACTLFQEILGPGRLFALRRRTADVPLPRPKEMSGLATCSLGLPGSQFDTFSKVQ